MKSTALLLSVFLFCCLFLTQCWFLKKDPEPLERLPSITQEGKNTFGCLIDGKPFLPVNTLGGRVHPLNCYYFSTTTDMYKMGSLFLQGIDVNNHGEIGIQKMNVFKEGSYLISYQPCDTIYHCDAAFYYNSKASTNYFAQEGELLVD
jgi:hypothetical protein